MRLFRGVLTVLLVAGAGLVVSAGPASADPASPPVVNKDFQPATAQLNQTVTLQISVENTQNAVTTLTGVTVTDTLPAGLVATPDSGTFCGGTYAATPSAISLTNLTLRPDIACVFDFEVHGT